MKPEGLLPWVFWHVLYDTLLNFCFILLRTHLWLFQFYLLLDHNPPIIYLGHKAKYFFLRNKIGISKETAIYMHSIRMLTDSIEEFFFPVLFPIV
jgi:hypothetical protein